MSNVVVEDVQKDARDLDACCRDIEALIRAWHDRGIEAELSAGAFIGAGVQLARVCGEEPGVIVSGIIELWKRLDEEQRQREAAAG